jgi:UDP-glucose 4-epimerase
MQKLRTNSNELEVLGDGTQSKSYVHISDGINGIFTALDSFLGSEKRVDAYNLSSPDQVSVKRIAQVVIEEFGLGNVKIRITGGVDGGRGWLGDVKYMRLSVDKLQKLGWHPRFNSEEAIRAATRELLANK